jgi:hypothetical protein
MRRPWLAGLLALPLSACAGSKMIAPPFFPTPPRPALAIPDPCRPAPLVTQPDHSLTSADAERAIRQGDQDLAQCRADRDRYRAALPS